MKSPRDDWRGRFVIALATPNSLEAYSAIFAALWGAGMLLWGADHWLSRAEFAALSSALHGQAWPLSIPMVSGLIGIYALSKSNRKMRALSSVISAVFWWALVGYFLLRESPSPSAVLAYGCSAFAEAWVYVRVSHSFDVAMGRGNG